MSANLHESAFPSMRSVVSLPGSLRENSCSFVARNFLLEWRRSSVSASVPLSRCYKVFEDGLGKRVLLPSDFGVPLHAQYESIRARVGDGLDHTVRRARDYAQVAPDFIYRLVVRAVDARRFPA